MATIEFGGKVTNQAGTALEGLTVELWTATNWEAGTSSTSTTTTDADGLWAFSSIAEETYIIVVNNADSTKKVLFDGRNEVQVTNMDIRSTLQVDTINEATSGSGVTIDGLLIKDSMITALDYGLAFQAIVTTYTDTTHFKASGLTGKGNDFFTDYYAYVVWDAGGAGAAPQGEIQPITDYTSSDGTFAHRAFSSALAATDEVLILHKSIAFAFGAAGPLLVVTDIATLASQTSFTLTAGSADDDAYNGMIAVIEDVATNTQKAVGVISDYTGSSKTITLREDPGIFTMATTDKVSIIAISPDILNILADTNELQADWANGGRLDLLLDAIPTTAMRGTDSAALASVLGALNTSAAAGAVTSSDEVMAYVKQLVTNSLRVVHSMDFWSDVDDLITIDTTAGDETLPAVTVAEIPTGAVVLRVIAMLKYRAIEDTSGSANYLVLGGTECIQVDKTGGTYIDAITLIASQWQVAASTRDGGDVMIGNIDIASEVDGNDTYEFKIENADAQGNNLLLRDVQVGLRVYFTLE